MLTTTQSPVGQNQGKLTVFGKSGLYVAVVLSAALLTACGGGGSSTTTVDTTTPTTTTTTPTTTTPTTTTPTTTTPTTTTPTARTFTKLNLTGAAYVADGVQTIGCVQDSKDNKFWEVKTNAANTANSDFRDVDYGYFWGTNVGSNAGTPSISNATVAASSCSGTGTALTKCNTDAYVKAVNAMNAGKGLCNKTTWRLPTSDELLGLLDSSKTAPPYIFTDVGSTAFDNTDTDGRPFVYAYWSATPVTGNASQRQAVSFSNKLANGQIKTPAMVDQINDHIRLIAD